MSRTVLKISFGADATYLEKNADEVHKAYVALVKKATRFNPAPYDVLAHPNEVFCLELIFHLNDYNKDNPFDRKNIVLQLYEKEIAGMFDHEIKKFLITDFLS